MKPANINIPVIIMKKTLSNNQKNNKGISNMQKQSLPKRRIEETKMKKSQNVNISLIFHFRKHIPNFPF